MDAWSVGFPLTQNEPLGKATWATPFNDDFYYVQADGCALGTVSRTLDSAALAGADLKPITHDALEVALKLILGRKPSRSEVRRAKESADNIADFYALLLERARKPR